MYITYQKCSPKSESVNAPLDSKKFQKFNVVKYLVPVLPCLQKSSVYSYKIMEQLLRNISVIICQVAYT